MPKLYEYEGYIFLFYSNDHRPRHMHVLKGDKQMKVEIEDEHYKEKDDKGTFIVTFKRIKGFHVFDGREKREITKFVNVFRADIVKKWNTVFVEQKQVSCDKVNKNLKKQNIISKLLGL